MAGLLIGSLVNSGHLVDGVVALLEPVVRVGLKDAPILLPLLAVNFALSIVADGGLRAHLQVELIWGVQVVVAAGHVVDTVVLEGQGSFAVLAVGVHPSANHCFGADYRGTALGTATGTAQALALGIPIVGTAPTVGAVDADTAPGRITLLALAISGGSAGKVENHGVGWAVASLGSSVLISADRVRFDLVVIVAILPHGPDLVDEGVVAEKERIGGGGEGTDVASEQVVRIGVGSGLDGGAEARVGSVILVLDDDFLEALRAREVALRRDLPVDSTGEAGGGGWRS